MNSDKFWKSLWWLCGFPTQHLCLLRNVNKSNASTLWGLASCTPAEKNLFWDKTRQPRTGTPRTKASSSLPRLLHAMRITSLAPVSPYLPPPPAHSLGFCPRGAKKNIYMNMLMKTYEFVWVCVIRGVLLWQEDSWYAKLKGCFIIHMWRWRHRIWSWVLLQNKGLNFDLQSRELYFNHDFIQSFTLSAQSPQKGLPALCPVQLCCFLPQQAPKATAADTLQALETKYVVP